MKNPHTATSIVLAIAILTSSNWAIAQEEPPKPGPEHELLEHFAGEWEATCKMWLPDVEEPIQWTGNYTAKMDVGGFFLISEFTSEMEGKPFKGRGITGYDPTKKKYVGVWIESTKPTMTEIVGEWNEHDKIYSETMTATMPDGTVVVTKVKNELKDEDRIVTKFSTPAAPDGAPAIRMEIEFVRKK